MEAIKVPGSILDELARQFGLYNFNFDPERFGDNNRLMAAIQKSYWCCVDEYRHGNVSFKSFAYQMFKRLPNLKAYTRYGVFGKAFRRFIEYNRCRPTTGAIIISEDRQHILLVQSLKSYRWSFPKGKIEDEDFASFGGGGDYDDDGYAAEEYEYDDDGGGGRYFLDPLAACACREVYEETSIDIRPLINPNDYCELLLKYHKTRLYWIENMPMNRYPLMARTRGEIRSIRWMKLDTLLHMKYNPDFMLISPFISTLFKRLNK
uniref:mRNA decapping enzyme 2-like protein n=1 Tax=Oryctes rhinoceros nudivirus TaxID=92521 RepID=A0A7D3QM65_9VIRU|nr:mRNA decapping enzyme 2-like protein [Oryctes rhinoceros nudivirus]UBO76507.1 mRNA decapping enzyme 2-like protein [Oryctes rhinoceros nudivirus]